MSPKPRVSPLIFDPEREMPDEERLEEADIETFRRFYRGNDGLHLIHLEAWKFDTPKPGQARGFFQKVRVSLAEDGSALVDPDRLAQIVYCCCEDFALAAESKTIFRCWVFGKHASGKDWKVHHKLVIDPSDYESDEEDSESDEDEVEEEQEEEAVQTPSLKPRPSPSPNSNGHARQAPAVVEAPAPAPVAATPAAQGQAHVDRYVQPMPQLPNLLELDPMSKAAREQGLQTDTVSFVPNAQFIVAMIQHGEQTFMRLAGGLMETLERGNKMIVEQCTKMLETQSAIMKDVCQDAIEQRKLANSQCDKLHVQLAEMTKHNNAHYENLQRIAAQGWQAFIDGMQMKGEAFAEREGYQRIISGQAIEMAHHQGRAEAAQAGGGESWMSGLKGVAPAFLAIAAAHLKEKKPETSAMLERLATILANANASAQPEYEEEEEDDEEEVVDATFHEPGNGKDSSPPEYSQSRPTVDAARALRLTLTDEQVGKLQKAMPKLAWEAFELAFTTDDEHVALDALAKLSPLVRNDASVQVAVIGVLKQEQVPLLMELVDGVKAKAGPRRAPPRPRANAAAGAAG
jgi:hypothetical protein